MTILLTSYLNDSQVHLQQQFYLYNEDNCLGLVGPFISRSTKSGELAWLIHQIMFPGHSSIILSLVTFVFILSLSVSHWFIPQATATAEEEPSKSQELGALSRTPHVCMNRSTWTILYCFSRAVTGSWFRIAAAETSMVPICDNNGCQWLSLPVE